MLSHVNLVEAILASKQVELSRRVGRTAGDFRAGPSFEAVLQKSLHRTPSVFPQNNEVNQRDGKFQEALRFVLEREGSRYVREDGGRESSKYGILQSTARAYGYSGNVQNLSRSEAEAIYRKLWEKSGAEALPFPLSTVHFDTYVNSPAAAERILARSKGNGEIYLRLREERYARLAETRPEQYGKYLKGWNNRIKSLRTMVAQYGQEANRKA